jgi:NADH:ubiquinone reductase (H+-translocating)
MQKQNERVIVLGGGFAGVQTCIRLAKQRLSADIILISNKTYFEYYPALYRVVTGASPIEVCVPLNDMVPKNVDIVLDTIEGIDLVSKTLKGRSGKIYEYDYLVLALGSETTYFNLPGLLDLAHGFKSVKEAVHLKKHLHLLFEGHEHPSQPELVSHFHIVIVGGGPSGVEVAGDLNCYMRNLAKHYGVDPSLITIDIIESGNRLVPALPESISEKVLRRLRFLGINVFLNRQLVSEEVENVYLKDMTMKSKTMIWTAGTKVNSLLEKIEGLSFTPKKKVLVDEYLRAVGQENVFVVGDAAGTVYSGLAQTAVYDGNYVGKQIGRILKNKNPKEYVPKKTAYAIPVGTDWGIFVWGKLHVTGRLAYWIRHMIDFIYFCQILSIRKLFSLFFEGWKYRSLIPKE